MEAPPSHLAGPPPHDAEADDDAGIIEQEEVGTSCEGEYQPHVQPTHSATSNTSESHMQMHASSISSGNDQQKLEEHLPHVTDSPPFWTRHGRTVSTVSYHSTLQHRPPPILLEDHSEEEHEQTQACWAQSVTIDEYVVVSGPTGIGAYVVWHCTVTTLHGGDLTIRKRYSEFDELRINLVRSFPHAESMIPQLPRKSVVSRFRPKFLEQRKAGLAHFMSCILLNPEFAASPVLKDFIFS